MARTHLLLYIYSTRTNQHFFAPLGNGKIGFTHSSSSLIHLQELLGEACGNLPQLGLEVLAERTFPVNGLEHLRLV